MSLPLTAHVALICDMGTRTGPDRGPRMKKSLSLSLNSSLLFLLETGFPAPGSSKATDGDIPGLKMTEGATSHRALSSASGAVRGNS